MKIAVNTANYEMLNSLIRQAKEKNNTITIFKSEQRVFENIKNEEYDAFILSSTTNYTQRAVDFLKTNQPYVPIVIIGMEDNCNITGADMIVTYPKGYANIEFLTNNILYNIYAYVKNFKILRKLTAKTNENVEFEGGILDPVRCIITYNGVELKKLSRRQTDVFEILISNFGNLVKKEIILEKIWQQANYFVGRSLDVYITHLRNMIKANNMPFIITSVKNVGLMIHNIK